MPKANIKAILRQHYNEEELWAINFECMYDIAAKCDKIYYLPHNIKPTCGSW